jgi:hypothetical protein
VVLKSRPDGDKEVHHFWGQWRGRVLSEGVPEHDWITPLLDGDEAGHPVLGMSVRSFSSVSKDFASTSGEANFQVLASHS